MNRRQQRFIERFIERERVLEGPRARQNTQSIRKSKQCVSDTLKGVRCRRRTAHTEKCWNHLAKYDNLRIKPSQIIGGGKGLYAWKKDFTRGKIIANFTGRKRTQRQLDRKYGSGVAKYAVCNSKGLCIDANHTTDGAARFVNDPRKTPFQTNAKIRGDTAFRLKATKRIPANREIFTSYGREYWL
jgi:hypothetical protein